MLKTFLKPGWVLLLLFVVAFSYLAFTVLAPWQLGKDDDIVERNELITHAYEADPQPVEDLVDGNGAIKNDEWSRATLHGHYLPQDEVLLRLRPAESGPSYQSLVPFRTDSGLTILVNRGWVKAGEGNAVPDIPGAPTGETTLTGMIRADEAQHQTAPIKQEGYQQVYSIHTEQIASLIDAPLAHDYIQLSADQPGVLNPMPIPQLDRGNHLSYGYQWIAFGIMAPLGLGYFVWSEIRERRRLREEEEALAALDADASTPSDPTTADASAADHAPAEPMAGADSAPSEHAVANDDSSAVPAASSSHAASRRNRSRYGDSKPDHYAKLNKRRRERY
ncbi:SURF1 family protein [Corynebacterium sp. c8Ua_181]|uniref:SURF1-like protein n=1 Tax=Corynebacterium curieae TaxID=2913500 RepID=A0A9X3RUT5_9CORY|nr:SURF1 family protein [Corynebacterium curieae]MCZ9306378.1 SURF1 family protein [Corynebacterium curieae]MDV2423143.1 SURF1 family protein [Corynebacterium curieae]